MKLRLRCDLILDPLDTATKDKIQGLLENIKPKLQRANIRETSTISIEKCYHDEPPAKPCEEIYRWEKV